MKPETADFLAASDVALSDAHTIQKANVPRQAARLAYYAQFHAAQALIFERTDKISKTHRGVNRQFHMLAKTEPAFPPSFATQLTKAYIYKAVADYDIANFGSPTPTQASDAIATAERFVTAVRLALDSS